MTLTPEREAEIRRTLTSLWPEAQPDVDDLLAELDRLRNQCWCGCEPVGESAKLAAAEIKRLRVELDAVSREAQRTDERADKVVERADRLERAHAAHVNDKWCPICDPDMAALDEGRE